MIFKQEFFENGEHERPNETFLKEEEKLPDTIRDDNKVHIQGSHIVLFISAHGFPTPITYRPDMFNLLENVFMFSVAGVGSVSVCDSRYNYIDDIRNNVKEKLKQNYRINAVLNDLRQQYVRPTVENNGVNSEMPTSTYKNMVQESSNYHVNDLGKIDETMEIVGLISSNKFAYKHLVTSNIQYVSNPCENMGSLLDKSTGMLIEVIDVRYPEYELQSSLQHSNIYQKLFDAGILIYDHQFRRYGMNLLDVIDLLKTSYNFTYITIIEDACRVSNDPIESKRKKYKDDIKNGTEWMKRVGYNQFGGNTKAVSRRTRRRKKRTHKKRRAVSYSV